MTASQDICMFASVDLSMSNACALHVLGIANGFARLGYTVTLIVPETEKTFFMEPFRNNNLKILFYTVPRFFRRPRFFGVFFALPMLYRAWKKNKKTYFYIRMSLLSWVAVLFARFYGIKTISEHNGWVKEEIELLGVPKLFSWIGKLIQQMDVFLAHRIRAVTEGLRKQLSYNDAAATRIFCAGNATNTTLFSPLSREEALAALHLSPTYFYLGFIGSLTRWQGVRYAIDALQLIQRDNPNIRLIIAGKGPEMENLRKQVFEGGLKDKIIFLGEVPFEKANTVINIFDIALAPATAVLNQQVGVSKIKIRDYAAAGRTILAARLPGHTEFESEGFLCTHAPDDPKDLAEKILQLQADPAHRQAMSARAREYALARFDWMYICQQILSAFAEI